ncbi:MAG: excinuclease ABC subunit UvrB [Bacteroidetes bacterium]|nr:excinuclease ABC subunit UvrB [Bacteroidota bacterium]MCL5738388.1 excinuclease ABC subunit UvrB [Bacteroidota bacterium]
MINKFKLVSEYKPSGDQPEAIRELTEGVRKGLKYQTLLGVTGSGKTYTMAQIMQNINKPTLVISHNKTLAAQLYGEFKQLFPENVVEFFISYYDYYQPEAYIPQSDTYIEKDSSINDEIDRLRLRATSSLLSGRKDVIVVASVSCIYGIGSPLDYQNEMVALRKGEKMGRRHLQELLIKSLYARNDVEFLRGTFRVRGDVLEIFPAYEIEEAIRVEFFGDEIESIKSFDPLTGAPVLQMEEVFIYPARHFVTSEEKLQQAIKTIEIELGERLTDLRAMGKYLEAQRLEQRTRFDIEMMREVGYCNGIENYSRHITQRQAGQRPYVLLDYFPKDFLMFIDESHQTLPQVRAMYHGDRSRKMTLVEYGFRLPSALDNRPLTFEEFESIVNQVIFVSATPSDYELGKSAGVIVEQVIRPTGIVDPEVEVRPVKNQIDDLIHEIRERVKLKERTLVTTLTKRMAEDLSEYLQGLNIRVKYIHSDIDSLERVSILRDLRLGEFDVLVGVNLLREGLDLPEVSLVAILDADKEGFLRSAKSLIQTAGRAARNIGSKVILYADTVTRSMNKMMDETARRRKIQTDFNVEHNIKPKSIMKTTEEIMASTAIADVRAESEEKTRRLQQASVAENSQRYLTDQQKKDLVERLTKEMYQAAKDLDFEKAAELRDEIHRLSGKH